MSRRRCARSLVFGPGESGLEPEPSLEAGLVTAVLLDALALLRVALALLLPFAVFPIVLFAIVVRTPMHLYW